MIPSKKSLRYALSVYICVCMFVCVYFEFYTSVDTLSQIEVTDQQNENSTINEETTTITLEEMSNLQASNKALVETNSSSESEK